MTILVPLLLVVGLFTLVRLTSGLPALRRAAIVVVGLTMFIVGLPLAFELGRVSESYERDIAEARATDESTFGDTPTTVEVDPIPILHCLDPALELDPAERDALADAGMTRVAMPFGVLLAADDRMPMPYVRQAAAVLAEMLDQDRDGRPDDPALVDLLADRSTAWLAMPVDE
ncbi:MAG: hypothetical protein GY895_22645, partial [Phycisphaera sp.]|nr:hypothetical protein [Phycisphaera sp.]